MIRLPCYEPSIGEWGAEKTDWWANIIRSIPVVDSLRYLDSIEQEWGARWEYGWSPDGDRMLFPQALVFENESDATMFLLRWA